MTALWSKDMAAPPEKVWDALTRPGELQPFYFNSLFEAELRPEGEIRYLSPDGKRLLIAGKVIEIVAGRKLVHAFRFADISEPPQSVTFEVEAIAAGTRVTIRHVGLEAAPKHAARVRRGWDRILANLKQWVETQSIPLAARMQNVMMHLVLKVVAPRR